MRVLDRAFRPSSVSSAGSTSSRAFSLTELLVAVGVIAVLIGLLLPTLASARESANRTKCLAHLRQLALAFTAYLNDNAGRFPRPAQGGVPVPEDWIHYQPNRDRDAGAIAKYVAGRFDAAVYRCPSDDPAAHRTYTINGSITQPITTSYPYSYTVNEAICRIVGRGPTMRVGQVRNASEKILLVEESADTIDDGCWAWQGSGGAGLNVMSVRHDRRDENVERKDYGRGNAAFVDGHAEYIGREDSFDARYFDPAK
jgi:prepilin-type processing-associated H-X9-DG protein